MKENDAKLEDNGAKLDTAVRQELNQVTARLEVGFEREGHLGEHWPP